MAYILTDQDFTTGQYVIPDNCFQSIDPYIDKYEKKHLVSLLGAELYDLFIADLSGGVPVSARFLDIFNPFHLDEGNCVYESEGMKSMLVQFVYFYILRDLGVKKTPTGVVFNVNENSEGPTYNGYNLIESYNEGVNNYDAIQWFICDNSSVYPEYNGQIKNTISGI